MREVAKTSNVADKTVREESLETIEACWVDSEEMMELSPVETGIDSYAPLSSIIKICSLAVEFSDALQ